MTKLNVRLLALLLVVSAAVGTSVFFLNRFQKARLVEAYLTQADNATRDGQPEKESDYLRRYLTLKPKDGVVRARQGMRMADSATQDNQRVEAFLTLQQALRDDPNLPIAVRVRCIKLALSPSINLESEARREVDILLKAEPDNAEAHDLLAQCLARQGEYKEAADELRSSIKLAPANVETYGKLAWVCRENLKTVATAAEADAVIVQMQKNNPQNSYGYLIAADYFLTFGNAEQHEGAVLQAKLHDPTSAAVMLAVAQLHLRKSRAAGQTVDKSVEKAKLAEAVKLLQDGITAHVGKLPAANQAVAVDGEPAKLRATVGQMFLTLCRALAEAGRHAEAEEWGRKGVAALPSLAGLYLELADVAIRQKKYDVAEEELAKLLQNGYPAAVVNYYRGRIASAQGKWAQACRLLEPASVELINFGPLARQAYLLLAECYQQVGELDRRYEAYRKAIPPDPLDPIWPRAVMGVANSLTEMGRLPEAIVELERLAPRSPDAAATLGRLRMLQTVAVPAARRNWATVEESIGRVPDGPAKELLRAELAMNRGDIPAARATLDKTLVANPDLFDLWGARLQLEINQKDAAKAGEILAKMEAPFGDTAAMRLNRLRVARLSGNPATVALLPVLAAGLEKYSPPDRALLLRGLAAAAFQSDKRDLAGQYLAKLSEERPDDLDVLGQRFELALREKDEKLVREFLAKIETASGGATSPPARLARAQYLLWRAESGDKAILPEAAELLSGLEGQRPNWSKLYVAQGRIADLRGDPSTAIQKYREGVDLGERSPEIITRLVQLYGNVQRFDDADQVISLMPENATPTGMSAQMMADYAARANKFERAAQLAKSAVPPDSKDLTKLLWQARIFGLAKQFGDAEKSLRRAIEVAPTRVEPLVPLVQLLASLKRLPEAEALIDQARGKLKPPEQVAVGLAACYEAIGKPDKARQLYQEALDARPNDLAVLRAVAAFRVNDRDFAGAETLLRKILGTPTRTPDDERFARRLLALTLAGSRDPRVARTALKELGFDSVEDARKLNGQETPDDLRTRAIALAAVPGRRAREAAIEVIETMELRAPLTTDDLFLLGRMYESVNRWDKARLRLGTAAQGRDVSLGMVIYYAATLLRHEDAGEARKWIDKIAELVPDPDATLELRAKLAVLQGKPDLAVKAVEDYAARTSRHEQAGQVLESVGLVERAEPYYRKHAATPNDPKAQVALVAYWNRANKATEALAEADRLWELVPPELLVPVVVEVLLNNYYKVTPEQMARFTPRLTAAAVKVPVLASYLAALKSLGGDHNGAIAMFRQVLAQQPNDLVGINCLAFLLSLAQGKHTEAVQMIQRGQALAAQSPTLMDTEAVILMAAGNPVTAIGLLEDVVIDEPTKVAFFHLAQAHLANGNRVEAVIAITEAKRRKLKVTDLHPLEAEIYKKVMSQLGE